MDPERYLRRSKIIEEMKQFCIENQITEFAAFMDYCGANNEAWFRELVTGTQVSSYMVKYLRSQRSRKRGNTDGRSKKENAK